MPSFVLALGTPLRHHRRAAVGHAQPGPLVEVVETFGCRARRSASPPISAACRSTAPQRPAKIGPEFLRLPASDAGRRTTMSEHRELAIRFDFLHYWLAGSVPARRRSPRSVTPLVLYQRDVPRGARRALPHDAAGAARAPRAGPFDPVPPDELDDGRRQTPRAAFFDHVPCGRYRRGLAADDAGAACRVSGPLRRAPGLTCSPCASTCSACCGSASC